ncbi:hypothetical protein T01_9829 [Trichinella spiralis]|uniref:Uncharacterized protein n=1 Tax=Trichinella spiralis TaxID=6334 RepID=A0A0V1C2L5_TRISP|nr:hypothetical protein T01_9829 [Trichinella spiralis]
MKGEATKKFEELTKKLDRMKRRVNDLITEVQHRCAENVEIEKIEAMVAEMDRIYSLAEDLQWSYEELLNEDDLATKVHEWNAFHYAVVDTRATFQQLDNRALCMPDNPCPDADPAGQPAPPVNGDGLGGANEAFPLPDASLCYSYESQRIKESSMWQISS